MCLRVGSSQLGCPAEHHACDVDFRTFVFQGITTTKAHKLVAVRGENVPITFTLAYGSNHHVILCRRFFLPCFERCVRQTTFEWREEQGTVLNMARTSREYNPRRTSHLSERHMLFPCLDHNYIQWAGSHFCTFSFQRLGVTPRSLAVFGPFVLLLFVLRHEPSTERLATTDKSIGVNHGFVQNRVARTSGENPLGL